MTNIVTTAASKAIVAFVAAAMIFTMFATPAKAQTVEELQAMITELMSQIAALSGEIPATGSANCVLWDRDLSMGSTGADVLALQKKLNENPDTRVAATGAGSMGMETEYYGALTAAAVSKFQMMYMSEILTPNGLVSGTGYFGPSTRAKMNSLCTSAPATGGETEGEGEGSEEEGEGTPAALEGGEGFIIAEVITDGAADVDLGNAKTVIEAEVEAVDSDIEISRVDFEFDERPWLYFSEVNLLVEGEVVATLDRSSDFTEVNDNYRARFTGLDLVLREDDIVEVALEVVAFSSLNAAYLDDTVTVTMDANDAIRFVDGAGFSETDGDAGSAAITFTDVFEDGTVDVTEATDSPESATIVVDETTRTDATVLIFEVEAEDADMEVTDVEVDFTVAGDGNSPNNVFYRAYLMDGSTELDRFTFTTNTVGGTQTATFDDLEFMIDEDDRVELSIMVEFEAGEDMGTTTGATFTVGDIVVTAENPNFVSDTDTLIVDETHTLVQEGIIAEISGTPSASTVSADPLASSTGQFRISVDVTAVGDTVWIGETAAQEVWADEGILYDIVDSSGNVIASTTGVVTESFTRVTGGTLDGSNVRINDGQTATFELYVTFDPETAGQYRLQAKAIGFNLSNAAADTAYTLSPTEDFRTPLTNVQ